MKKVALSAILSLLMAAPARCWNGEGHEVVAYIAYQHLDAATRIKVDELMKRNPCYSEWVSAVSTLPEAERPLGLFMLAATWPDEIKRNKYDCELNLHFGPDGARNGDEPPSGPEAGQNTGYDDTHRHKYWHFVDIPFSTDGTPTKPPAEPNVPTEVPELLKALASGESEDLKSYDLVWIEHLVGDVHQPLHDTSRFTKNHPDGDAGGNLVPICDSPNCRQELHAYWDDILGTENLEGAISLGKQLNGRPQPDGANNPDVHAWVSEGFELAKKDVYRPPISADEPGGPIGIPDTQYHDNARKVAEAQVLLAGYRLAWVLNHALAN